MLLLLLLSRTHVPSSRHYVAVTHHCVRSTKQGINIGCNRVGAGLGIPDC